MSKPKPNSCILQQDKLELNKIVYFYEIASKEVHQIGAIISNPFCFQKIKGNLFEFAINIYYKSMY